MDEDNDNVTGQLHLRIWFSKHWFTAGPTTENMFYKYILKNWDNHIKMCKVASMFTLVGKVALRYRW